MEEARSVNLHQIWLKRVQREFDSLMAKVDVEKNKLNEVDEGIELTEGKEKEEYQEEDKEEERENRIKSEHAIPRTRGDADLLPLGVEVLKVVFHAQEGIAEALFQCVVPFPSHSTALQLIPLMDLKIDVGLYTTSYPVEPPVVYITQGAEYVPPNLVERRGHERILKMPLLTRENWSSSYKMVTILAEFFKEIQKDDMRFLPGEISNAVDSRSRAPTSVLGKHEREKLPEISAEQLTGSRFVCQEKTSLNHSQQVVVVISTAALFVVYPNPSKADSFYLKDTLSLQDISKVLFKKSHSVSFNFYSGMPVRTFFTPRSDELVRIVQENLSRSGIESVSRNEDVAEGSSKGFTFSAISDAAKDMKSSLLGKWGSFRKGVKDFFAEDENTNPPPPLVTRKIAPGKIATLRRVECSFFENPSKQKAYQVVALYQSLSRECHLLGDQRSYEEMLVELNTFRENAMVRPYLKD